MRRALLNAVLVFAVCLPNANLGLAARRGRKGQNAPKRSALGSPPPASQERHTNGPDASTGDGAATLPEPATQEPTEEAASEVSAALERLTVVEDELTTVERQLAHVKARPKVLDLSDTDDEHLGATQRPSPTSMPTETHHSAVKTETGEARRRASENPTGDDGSGAPDSASANAPASKQAARASDEEFPVEAVLLVPPSLLEVEQGPHSAVSGAPGTVPYEVAVLQRRSEAVRDVTDVLVAVCGMYRIRGGSDLVQMLRQLATACNLLAGMAVTHRAIWNADARDALVRGLLVLHALQGRDSSIMTGHLPPPPTFPHRAKTAKYYRLEAFGKALRNLLAEVLAPLSAEYFRVVGGPLTAKQELLKKLADAETDVRRLKDAFADVWYLYAEFFLAWVMLKLKKVQSAVAREEAALKEGEGAVGEHDATAEAGPEEGAPPTNR